MRSLMPLTAVWSMSLKAEQIEHVQAPACAPGLLAGLEPLTAIEEDIAVVVVATGARRLACHKDNAKWLKA